MLPETVAAMRARGPGARGLLQVQEIAGCGHAPALNVPEQLALVERFLAENDGGGLDTTLNSRA